MSKHHLSAATSLLAGAAYYSRHSRNYEGARGYLLTPMSLKSIGAAATIVAGALIASATGAELPNATTTTYTTATAGTSPLDSGSIPTVASVVMADGTTQSVWPLDVPRNVTLAVTHGSSIVAVSVVVSGYDEYGEAISETLSVTATGTSKTAAGKKAFKWLKSYAITSAGDSTTDTLSLAWGNVFGLPYRVTDKNNVIVMADGAPDASAVVVVADDNTISNTTGDTRGTVAPSVAANGTKKFAAWIVPSDPSTKSGLFGVGASA